MEEVVKNLPSYLILYLYFTFEALTNSFLGGILCWEDNGLTIAGEISQGREFQKASTSDRVDQKIEANGGRKKQFKKTHLVSVCNGEKNTELFYKNTFIFILSENQGEMYKLFFFFFLTAWSASGHEQSPCVVDHIYDMHVCWWKPNARITRLCFSWVPLGSNHTKSVYATQYYLD